MEQVILLKDRGGGTAGNQGATIAELHIGGGSGSDKLVLKRSDTASSSGAFRPTWYMARICNALTADDGLSLRELRAAVGKTNQHCDAAIALLKSEGYVRVERDGAAHRHYLLKPFEEAGDDPDAPPI